MLVAPKIFDIHIFDEQTSESSVSTRIGSITEGRILEVTKPDTSAPWKHQATIGVARTPFAEDLDKSALARAASFLENRD